MTREELAAALLASGQVPRQPLPPEMTVPPLPERGNMFERAMPKVYDPLQRTQQEIGGAAFGMTGMGALADLAEARTPGEAMFAGAAVTPVGKIAGKGVKAAAKLGDLAATEKGLVGFAPGELFADPKLKAKAEALRGKYPQYAEQYPPVGPPDLIAKPPDPANPGKFLATGGKPVPYASMEEALLKDAEPGFYLGKKKLAGGRAIPEGPRSDPAGHGPARLQAVLRSQEAD